MFEVEFSWQLNDIQIIVLATGEYLPAENLHDRNEIYGLMLQFTTPFTPDYGRMIRMLSQELPLIEMHATLLLCEQARSLGC